jgi:hypothetical protein
MERVNNAYSAGGLWTCIAFENSERLGVFLVSSPCPFNEPGAFGESSPSLLEER